MSTPTNAADCRKRATELEEMAATVSFQKDRDSLSGQAHRWRRQAELLDGAAALDPPLGPETERRNLRLRFEGFADLLRRARKASA